MGFYPIGDGLMANTQRPSNPALIHAVHVQVQGLMANFLGVACFACYWRVFSSAYFAHIALATRCIMTDFDLLFASFTVRTFYHPVILPYPHTLPLPELWSYVGNKRVQCWLWLALDVETRLIVGCAIGPRTDETAQALWDSLPAHYRQHAVLYTDFWQSYLQVFPSKRHRAVGKHTGLTH